MALETLAATSPSTEKTGETEAAKRAFCKRCSKAMSKCICNLFKGVVNNNIGVTVLQHPQEKLHCIGSVRIASLGLANINIVDIPQVEHGTSYRVRDKVPDSKRSIQGRVGRRGRLSRQRKNNNAENHKMVAHKEEENINIVAQNTIENSNNIAQKDSQQDISIVTQEEQDMNMVALKLQDMNMVGENQHEESKEIDTYGDEECKKQSIYEVPSWFTMPSNAALLYPSENARILHVTNGYDAPSSSMNNNVDGSCPIKSEFENIKHLIVLDGTWPKAHRIYHENPWLHSLPHLRLRCEHINGIYSGARREPRPGCLSTLESIVYALSILEPESQEGLKDLLSVFESMVSDQIKCREEGLAKHNKTDHS